LLAVGVLIVVSIIGYNNRAVAMPSREEFSDSLEKSIVWLENNKQAVLDVYNPILWYRVKEAAEITRDTRLKDLYSLYEQRFFTGSHQGRRLWMPLFVPDARAGLRDEDVTDMPQYLSHWMYALHCSEALGAMPTIAAQNDAAFCGKSYLYLFNTTCTAHQMTGMLFLKQNGCADAAQVDATIATLQERLVRLLTFDARVVDIYLQRTLKLAESGRVDLIKPVWLRRMLDAQQPDGGWANFDPLVSIGNGRYIGFGHASSRTGNPRGDGSSRGLSVGEAHSTFHATAQSLLLLSLLVHAPM
jgi:hypothetical protein